MKQLLLLAAVTIPLIVSAQAELVLGYDFQTTTTGGTAAVTSVNGSVSSPLVYQANFGTGTLYLNGTNGSSPFNTGVANPQVSGAAGTAINAGTGFATTTTSPAALSLGNSSANGFRAVFAFSLANLSSLTISYATQATTSGTGFDLQSFSYSGDGVTFTPFATYSPESAGAGRNFASNGVVTLPTLTALDGDSTAYIGLTLTGAEASGGTNFFDNIQFNAVPEPSTYVMLLAGVGAMALVYRRKAGMKA